MMLKKKVNPDLSKKITGLWVGVIYMIMIFVIFQELLFYDGFPSEIFFSYKRNIKRSNTIQMSIYYCFLIEKIKQENIIKLHFRFVIFVQVFGIFLAKRSKKHFLRNMLIYMHNLKNVIIFTFFSQKFRLVNFGSFYICFVTEKNFDRENNNKKFKNLPDFVLLLFSQSKFFLRKKK